MTDERDVAIITGASRGLGLEVARALAERGMRLVLVARHSEPLRAAETETGRHTEVEVIAADVAVDAERIIEAAIRRFGRVDVFGQGPVNGVCPAPAASIQCTTDGYVSRHAWGYRLAAGLRYANVAEGVDLVPSILFGHDVSGWAGDGGILEGRKLVVAALRANMRNGFTAELAWWPTWGGTYNNQRDRSAVQFAVGRRF